MRDGHQFQVDLIAILVSSLALVPLVVFTGGPLRIVLGVVFVLFFPGYALTAALFTRRGSLGGVERIALGFGLSIAVVSLIGLILNYTPWGIRLYPILIAVLSFILAMSGVAYFRRKKLLPEERFTVSFNFKPPSWHGRSVLDKVLSAVLVAAIIGALGSLTYVISAPKVGERFTEFYILGPQGKAEGHPTNLKLGEKGEIILGVVNHEQGETDYEVKVLMNGTDENVKVWLENENKEIVAIANSTINIEALAHEEKWERRLFFEPLQKGGKQKVEFLLFSPKLRENHHIRSQLSSGNYVDIMIDETEGKGKIILDNKSSVSYIYRIEVWQEETIQREVSFSIGSSEKLDREVEFPSGEAIFQLYENDELVLKDTGAELSLHLWVDVS